ncbi:MarR family winged helix-turn-helix transcriptional regulator [Aliikangiella coralliicola]|uniref:MarR family transcriptional regulator n=1 Tax=Aliikangiella coralliicola TaxID=2592383 RepID=A0A545UJG4_9GAMM|nr:MarR family transcriptional regulator [Aliikangiella coralliicola]TQV89604.1 MarR family transcriptional regulator [Aliikangiella coralliicola]
MNKNQVEEFHQEIVELVKKYQFRDREQIVCSGISVSQCYILETLHTNGPLTVSELAGKMHLSISTITRVFDQLVKKELAVRERAPNDKRVYLCHLTEKGEAIYQQSWTNIFESEKAILANFQPEHREMLIDFLKKLNHAVDQWQSQC